VNNQAELDTLFKKVVALGYEGLVLKQPKSTYFDGDSHEWAKMKHVADLDLAIVGFQTGTKKAKKLSVMVAYQKDGQLVNLTHVGGGFELAEKDALLPLLQKDAIGKVGIDEMVTPKYVATIQHYGIIHNADGTISSLRHPQFKCLRPDKTIAQVDTL
jgi:DNA ligase-1